VNTKWNRIKSSQDCEPKHTEEYLRRLGKRLLLSMIFVCCASLPLTDIAAKRNKVTGNNNDASVKRLPKSPEESSQQRESFERYLEIENRANFAHSTMLSKTPKEANQFVNDLNDADLEAHLHGLSEKSRNAIGYKKHTESDGNGDTARENRSKILREKYRLYLVSEIEANAQRYVSHLTESERNSLLDFAMRTGITDGATKGLKASVVWSWRDKIAAESAKDEAEFPLLNPRSERRRLQGTLPEQIKRSISERKDPHEENYSRKALSDYVANSSRLSSLGLNQWSFGPDSIRSLWSVIKRLEDPIPGVEPQIVYFLDPAFAHSAISEMSQSWTNKSRAKPRIMDHEDIEHFLSEFKNQTVILIGHIENRQFVQERGPGIQPLRLDIATLITAAERRGVFLLTIGCNSAKEGAYFGFTRPISSSEVAALLGAIPKGAMVVGELLAAFNQIGSISIDAMRFDAFLEVTIRKVVAPGESVVGDSTRRDAILVARIPNASLGNTNAIGFDDFFSEWEAKNRPILDRGIFRTWRDYYRNQPMILVITGFAAWAGSLFVDLIRSKWLRRRKLISKLERGTLTTARLFGLGLIVIGSLHLLLAIWPILIVAGLIIFALRETNSINFNPGNPWNERI
jgi:hypothetical protein